MPLTRSEVEAAARTSMRMALEREGIDPDALPIEDKDRIEGSMALLLGFRVSLSDPAPPEPGE